MAKTGKCKAPLQDQISIKQHLLRKDFSKDLFIITCNNVLKHSKSFWYEKEIAEKFLNVLQTSDQKDFNDHFLAIKIKIMAHEINMRSSSEYQENN